MQPNTAAYFFEGMGNKKDNSCDAVVGEEHGKDVSLRRQNGIGGLRNLRILRARG